MLRLPKKTPIQLSLKRQTHPWDMVAEKANNNNRKEKKTAQKAALATVSLFTGEYPSPVIITVPEPTLETSDEALRPFCDIDEPENDEGFFLCPNCTCWFTNQKDLTYHLKKWCDRQW